MKSENNKSTNTKQVAGKKKPVNKTKNTKDKKIPKEPKKIAIWD